MNHAHSLSYIRVGVRLPAVIHMILTFKYLNYAWTQSNIPSYQPNERYLILFGADA